MLKFLQARRVQVALNDKMCPHEAHGAVWVRKLPTEQGISNPKDALGYTAKSFMADKPKLLVNPTRGIIRGIYEDMRDLGFEILHIEVRVNGEPQLYAL